MALAIHAQTLGCIPPPVPVPNVQANGAVRTAAWRTGLPVLAGSRVHVRELRISDAPALLRALTPDEVTRFISPPPTTVEGFERFITWAIAQRAAGEYLCFAVVPNGSDDAIGIIQVRQLNGSFETAEWGFAIAPAFWGTGAFVNAAQLVLAFCFGSLGVQRLEARAATVNGRGNGALRKLGASCEGLLRRSFLRAGRAFDQYLWAIVSDDWQKAVWGAPAVALTTRTERVM